MEQDAAPAGGRRTRLPRTRAARGAPPAATTSRQPELDDGYGLSLPADGVPESASPAQQVPFTTVGEAE